MSLVIRAPSEDGAILAVPAWSEVGSLIDENRDRQRRTSGRLLDCTFDEVRRLARRQLIHSAQDYTQRLCYFREETPLLMAGHQPELFHPGVWAKNFALAGLARRHHGLAVNFLVDNDVVKRTALSVPMRGDPWPVPRSVPFDRGTGELPWEERRLLDRGIFDDFAPTVTNLLRAWDIEPLLPAFWHRVSDQLSFYHDRLGESFAAARRQLEQTWGCGNLELPWSTICQGEAFARFAGALLADLPTFVAVYNQVVRDYRRRLRIRSRSHPVPDLASEGDWLETPFWGWHTEQPRRGRLFARLHGDQLHLRTPEGSWATLPSPTAPGDRFLLAWQELAQQGYKLRSRALVTTMFARLLLCDLFVHGIGGAKYDELTDEIVRRYWRITPPAVLVVSATKRLPLPSYSGTRQEWQQLTHRIRDLHYNPQRYVAADPRTAEKDRWIHSTPTTRSQRRERFHRIRELSAQLRPEVADQLATAQARLDRLNHELQANALVQSREFAFCLFPEATLRPFCEQVLYQAEQ